MTGLDARDGIELLYHFCFDKEHTVLTVKTKVAKPILGSSPSRPSCPVPSGSSGRSTTCWACASTAHPRPERLILADDWPEGVHPLRKDERP